MANHLASLDCGGGSGVTTLVRDNFNTAAVGTVLSSETPAIGPKPTNTGDSEFVIQGPGRATPASAATTVMDIYASLSSANVTVTCVIFSIGASNDTGVVGRYQDLSNYWYCHYDNNLAWLAITEHSGGSNTVRASTSVVSSGDTLKVVFSGNNITATLVNAAINASYTSSDFASNTSFGIGSGIIEGAAANGTDLINSPLTVTTP